MWLPRAGLVGSYSRVPPLGVRVASESRTARTAEAPVIQWVETGRVHDINRIAPKETDASGRMCKDSRKRRFLLRHAYRLCVGTRSSDPCFHISFPQAGTWGARKQKTENSKEPARYRRYEEIPTRAEIARVGHPAAQEDCSQAARQILCRRYATLELFTPTPRTAVRGFRMPARRA